MKRIYLMFLKSAVLGPALLLTLWLQPGMAEVQVKLSQTTVRPDEPVMLQLQIKGQNSASPDLSVLRQDFKILGHSSQQSMSVINGEMYRTQGLTLTLLPKRTGSLSIPSIPVGMESSDPLILEVLPNPGGLPAFTPPPPQPEISPIPPEPRRETGVVTQRGRTENGFPAWIAWILGIGWLATMIGWWLSRRRKNTPHPVIPPEVSEASPRDELADVIDALETAYRAYDREGARAAWLRWARYHWPEQPPSNLNRLAQRCNHNIALAVKLLDRAFYSPENPDDWRQFNPRELLEPEKAVKAGATKRESLIPSNP